MEIMNTGFYAVIRKNNNSLAIVFIASDEESCVEYCEYIAQKNEMELKGNIWKNGRKSLQIVELKKEEKF